MCLNTKGVGLLVEKITSRVTLCKGLQSKGESNLPVKPHASAKRKVLHDIKKNKPVSNNWNSRNLVNFVT